MIMMMSARPEPTTNGRAAIVLAAPLIPPILTSPPTLTLLAARDLKGSAPIATLSH